VSAEAQAQQLRELFDRLALEPRLRVRLDGALRAVEAATSASESAARFVETVTPAERELLLRLRHPDPDRFLEAWEAGLP
jgi:hypothetical protein